jgi:hypothetical protein
MAEFENPQGLIEATRRTHEAGYRRFDSYSPFPIEELHEAMHFHDGRLPLIVLLGGVVGAITGYAMQYFAAAVDYPMNVAGKPFHSWPMNIVITFEMTILFAAFSAVLGMLALNHLPMPYHPVFNVDEFAQASRNRFFLVIEARDPRFEVEKTREFLESLSSQGVHEVGH